MKIDRELKILLISTAVLGVLIPIIMFVSAKIVPFCSVCYLWNADPSGNTLTQWSVFQTWDAYHYLYLATHWYAPDIMQNAFYPLLPALLRLGSIVFFKQTLLTGFIVSNLLLLGIVTLLYTIVKSQFQKQVAFVSCVFLLAFPTSFFFHLIYTESLFLFLVLLLFYALNKQNLLLVCLIGILLPLTRPQGVLVLVPVLFFLLTQRKIFHLVHLYVVFMSFAVGFL
ncbi:MAG TPA: glycosyltransferase family 39 protein, partial [Patescibacteria group bacterium]|nr:glycosyltransferase family 39 protein [Patescibacteria group bacterium]